MAPCGDEEYVGAVLGFAQELSRYALGRAAEVSTFEGEVLVLVKHNLQLSITAL